MDFYPLKGNVESLPKRVLLMVFHFFIFTEPKSGYKKHSVAYYFLKVTRPLFLEWKVLQHSRWGPIYLFRAELGLTSRRSGIWRARNWSVDEKKYTTHPPPTHPPNRRQTLKSGISPKFLNHPKSFHRLTLVFSLKISTFC